MARTPVGGGSGGGRFISWDHDGQTVAGIWRGKFDGNFGPVGIVDTEDDGRLKVPLTIQLVDDLKDFRNGQWVEMVFIGVQESRSGRTWKRFKVYKDPDKDEKFNKDDEDE